jgi:pyruvyltransferase
MRAYWHPTTQNFGDTLTPAILRHLGYRPERADRNERGKVVAVGSIMNVLRGGDVVWGAGVQIDTRHVARTATFLAVRGPITRSCIDGARVPQVYGDPALLLPEIYDPPISPSRTLGVMPHYMDAGAARRRYPDALIIDVKGGWRRVIRQVRACERIITTSLHGVIVCDAYDIPCVWEPSYSGRIVSKNLKFQDHFLATRGRCLTPGPVPPMDRQRYERICDRLKDAAKRLPN